MRTYKFRAWDKNKKYMFEVIGISWFANHSSIWQVSGYDILEPIDNVDIMQFTGLKDKNGREIYEKGKVRHNGKLESIVKWDDENASWVIYNKTMGNMNISRIYFVEVIGNEYEN